MGPDRAQGPGPWGPDQGPDLGPRALGPGPGTRPWGPDQGPDLGPRTLGPGPGPRTLGPRPGPGPWDPDQGPGPWDPDQGPGPWGPARDPTLGPGTIGPDLGPRTLGPCGPRAPGSGALGVAPDPWSSQLLSRPPAAQGLDFRWFWNLFEPRALPNATGAAPRAGRADYEPERVILDPNDGFLVS